MVNAIHTSQNIYTSGVQYSAASNNYTSIANENYSYYESSQEANDLSIVSESIVEKQNEIFCIQLNTQNGITVINTAKSAVDNIQNALLELKEKLNSMSSMSNDEIYALKGEIDEIVDEIYNLRNGAEYNGELVFGPYNPKPQRLREDSDALKEDSAYMDKTSVQIGFSDSENPIFEFETAFSMGNFDIRVNSKDDLATAKSVVESFEKDLSEYEKSLDTNKSTLTQNYEAASSSMKNLISYEGEAEMTNNLYASKILAEIQATLVSGAVSSAYGFSHGKLVEVMTGVWGL